MKLRLRSLTSCCLGLLTLGLLGCDNATDPDVVTGLDLKPPGNLSIRDKGNGSFTLMWNTANPEDDFEGYNIYGAQIDDLAAVGLTEGEPLKLVNTAGEPSDAAKTALDAFSFDTGNANVLVASAAGAPIEISDAKFAALPLHNRDSAGEPLLPSCVPTAGVCNYVTQASDIDAAKTTSFGVVSFEFSGLSVGKQYCFLVFSVQNGGAEVSQSSSNVACIKPRYLINSGSVTMPASGYSGQYFQLRSFLTACESATGCASSLAYASSDARTSGQINNVYTDAAASFEAGYVSSSTDVFLATGQNAFIRPMGFFKNGFSDELLSQAPAFTYANPLNNADHGGGYSREGQSVVLNPGNMYVIAVGDAAKTDTTNYRYHWLWIDAANTSVVRGSAFTFQLMLASHTGVK